MTVHTHLPCVPDASSSSLARSGSCWPRCCPTSSRPSAGRTAPRCRVSSGSPPSARSGPGHVDPSPKSRHAPPVTGAVATASWTNAAPSTNTSTARERPNGPDGLRHPGAPTVAAGPALTSRSPSRSERVITHRGATVLRGAFPARPTIYATPRTALPWPSRSHEETVPPEKTSPGGSPPSPVAP